MSALLLAMLALGTSEAKADPVTFSTSGTFTCAGCAGSGTNSVTFLGGMGNALMITFTGLGSTSLEHSDRFQFWQLSNFCEWQRRHQRFRYFHSDNHTNSPDCRKR